MGTFDISELEKVPFIRREAGDIRQFPCLTFYDGVEWHAWIAANQRLIKMSMVPIEAEYFGISAAAPTDLTLRLLSFIAKYAFIPPIARSYVALCSDVQNLGASLGKLALFYRESASAKSTITRFVVTELEYIVQMCRSVFDLLQEIIAGIWSSVSLVDPQAKKKQLPKSFADVALTGKRRRTRAEIEEKYQLPTSLAEFYETCSTFFLSLRSYRDAIVHLGKEPKLIFVTTRGFAVPRHLEPFASFGIWNDVHLQPNGLASLRPIVAHVIFETLMACEMFAERIAKTIQFQSDMVPGFELYCRGHHIHELLRLDRIITNCSWWDEEIEPMPRAVGGANP